MVILHFDSLAQALDGALLTIELLYHALFDFSKFTGELRLMLHAAWDVPLGVLIAQRDTTLGLRALELEHGYELPVVASD